MATTDKPSASIAPQGATNTPTTSDDTLVDDTVALVDDTTALVGGPATITENVKSKVYSDRPKAAMPRSR